MVFLQTISFVSAASNSSLSIYKHGGISGFILVYVDDIIVTGTSSRLINTLIIKLSKKFRLKDMGWLQFFLGMELKPCGKNGSMVLS